jgi:hypothetical protein
MSGLYPLMGFVVIAMIWTVTFVLGIKLLREFVARFPHEASALIPHALSYFGHPEKLFFPFRKNVIVLLKRDPYLWRLRQQLKLMLWLSLTVPLFFMISICLYAVWETTGEKNGEGRNEITGAATQYKFVTEPYVGPTRAVSPWVECVSNSRRDLPPGCLRP